MAGGGGLARHPICQLKCSCQQMQMAACLLTFCPVMVSQLLFFHTGVLRMCHHHTDSVRTACRTQSPDSELLHLGVLANGSSTDVLKTAER